MEEKEKVRDYIRDNMNIFDDEVMINDDDNIFQLGFVNSFFAMKLLNFVEAEFDIKVDDEDIDISNFATVNKIVMLIERKRKRD